MLNRTDTAAASARAPSAAFRDERLAVIIASAQRPLTLRETLLSLRRQRRLPAQIIVSVPGEDDVPPRLREEMPGVTVIHAAIGSSRQRNAAIDALRPEIAVVTFLDDDVELQEGYLDHVARLFEARSDVVLADGCVLADGRDIPRARAQEIIAAAGDASEAAPSAIGPELAYGCNMTVRRSALAVVRFDERLPLYGYMEDRDFAFACARRGGVARCEAAALVHLRPAGGRGSPRRFGFSQVMNPLYLWRKGNYLSWRNVAWQVSRPLLVNAALTLSPRHSRHRRQQLAGNCRALAAALRGRIAPEEMLRL